jgi:hypothetical protein
MHIVWKVLIAGLSLSIAHYFQEYVLGGKR